MQAGSLRHTIVFDEPVASQSASGDEVITWTPAVTAQASIEPLQGNELLRANAIDASIDTRIRIRFSRDTSRITAKWRARFRDIVYNISAPPVNVQMRDREIQIMASSGRNDG